MTPARLLIVALWLAPVGCDSDDASGEGDTAADEGASSGSGGLAPCSEQPTVTYDTFGRGFLATYCDGCHGSEVAGDTRQGAPPEVVFDSREGAEMFADRILARAAPEDGSEPTMPPVGGVTDEDRDRVTVWLTCFP